jgi:molybdopterin-guanine dinucleotide biosynthesis protein A
MPFLCVMFFMHLCKQSRKLQDVLVTEHTKVRVQLVCLMMNT